jgi:hypothetical protein
MYPISQQKLETFKREAIKYGWQGQYGEGYPWNMVGVNWSLELQSLYDAYNMTIIEIYLVSAICLVVALSCSSYAVYLWRKQQPQKKLSTFFKEVRDK